MITDSTGAKVQALTYFPYGATRTNNSTATPAIDVAYKYTGQEFDASTGLYDYGARQYDASLGRFLSPDTLVPDPENPQSLNRYSYVRNNPFRYSDPTGQMELDGVGCIDCLPSSLFPLIPIIGQYGVNFPTTSRQENFASYMTQSAFAPEIEMSEISVTSSRPGSVILAQMKEVALGFVPGYDLYTAFANPQAGPLDYTIGVLGVLGPLGKEVGLGVKGMSASIEATKNAETVLQHLNSILKPGGKLIGEAGSRPGIRLLPGDIKAAEDLTLDLGKLGQIRNHPKVQDGVGIDLPGGGFIGFRPHSGSGGPAIDIDVPGFGGVDKIHFK